MGRAPRLGPRTLRHGLARKRAERHRPPELTGARPPENKRESGKIREPREVTLGVPRIWPAHFPFAEGAGGPPLRARGAKRIAGSSPAHPESTRGNVSRLPLRGAASPAPPTNPQLQERKRVPAPREPAPPRPRALTFQTSPASASASASAQVPKSTRETFLLLPGAKGSPAPGRGDGRGRMAGGGVFRERALVGGAAAAVRQGAAEGFWFRLRLGEGLGGLVRGREDCAG